VFRRERWFRRNRRSETTLDAPLAAYRVEDGEVLPAR
jgi:hypothetical protein